MPIHTRQFDGRKSLPRRQALEGQAGSDEAGPVTLDLGAERQPIVMGTYRKTVLTFAAQIDHPFEVWTNEGAMQGKAGDYLAVGAAGEMYPIDRAVFETTYEAVADD